MDKKGIGVYLLVTFGLGYLAQVVLQYLNFIAFSNQTIFHTLVLVAVLFIPAFGALVAGRVARSEAYPSPVLWPIPVPVAVQIALVVPCVFALIYTISALAGWSDPHWKMGTLINQLEYIRSGINLQPLSPQVLGIAPKLMLVLFPLVSIVVGVSITAAIALGSELGWRGYLLPRLLRFGCFPAYIMVGLLWGLWFVPLIVGWHIRHDKIAILWPNLLCFMGIALALSAVLGGIYRKTHHLGLAAIFLGSFVSQTKGLWGYLFPITVKPWSGALGVVAIVVWLLVALVPIVLVGRTENVPAAKVDPED